MWNLHNVFFASVAIYHLDEKVEILLKLKFFLNPPFKTRARLNVRYFALYQSFESLENIRSTKMEK